MQTGFKRPMAARHIRYEITHKGQLSEGEGCIHAVIHIITCHIIVLYVPTVLLTTCEQARFIKSEDLDVENSPYSSLTV